MKKVIAGKWAPVLLLLLLAACARPPAAVWTELPDVEEVLQGLVENGRQFISLDAEATVVLDVDGRSFSSQQFLLLEKPDRLRADVLTGFGQLLLQLTSDGDDLAVFSNADSAGHFFRGAATAENLSRFTRIPMPAEDLIRLMLYDPPLIAYQQSRVLERNSTLLVQLNNPLEQLELLFDSELQLTGYRYSSDGRLVLEARYERIDQQLFFPRTIRVNLPEENTSVVIKLSELQLNAAIPVQRFRLAPPDNIDVEQLP